MNSCVLYRDWTGLCRLSKNSVDDACLIFLGCGLLPHDPFPWPGLSGIVRHHIKCSCVMTHFTNKLSGFCTVLTVRVRREPGHVHHRHVPTSPEEAACQRAAGPGHCCGLFPAGAATPD